MFTPTHFVTNSQKIMINDANNMYSKENFYFGAYSDIFPKIYLKGFKIDSQAVIRGLYNYGYVYDKNIFQGIQPPFVEKLEECHSGYHYFDMATLLKYIWECDVLTLITPAGEFVDSGDKAICNTFTVQKVVNRFTSFTLTMFELKYIYDHYEDLLSDYEFNKSLEIKDRPAAVSRSKELVGILIDLIHNDVWKYHEKMINKNSLVDSGNDLAYATRTSSLGYLKSDIAKLSKCFFHDRLSTRQRKHLPIYIRTFLYENFRAFPALLYKDENTYLNFLKTFYNTFILEIPDKNYDFIFNGSTPDFVDHQMIYDKYSVLEYYL